MLGMETDEGIIKLIPKPSKAEEELLAKIQAIDDHLATVDPKASQQGREPRHVVTGVEYVPPTLAPGTEQGSAGFDDVCQDLLGRADRLIAALREGGLARGEGFVPARQDLLELLRAMERKIIALDLKVSGFVMAAHAALLHALIAHKMEDGKHLTAILARARYNIVRA
ncbi:MAG: hypothetical protein Q6365_003655 [Candidatus Sigynarchaeota archaeon]